MERPHNDAARHTHHVHLSFSFEPHQSLVFKLERLSTTRIDRATPITSPLLLVLLLGESLTSRDAQILVRTIGIIVADILVIDVRRVILVESCGELC